MRSVSQANIHPANDQMQIANQHFSYLDRNEQFRFISI